MFVQAHLAHFIKYQRSKGGFCWGTIPKMCQDIMAKESDHLNEAVNTICRSSSLVFGGWKKRRNSWCVFESPEIKWRHNRNPMYMKNTNIIIYIIYNSFKFFFINPTSMTFLHTPVNRKKNWNNVQKQQTFHQPSTTTDFKLKRACETTKLS